MPPPALEKSDKNNPSYDVRYKNLPAQDKPMCESLKDTVARVLPCFKTEIIGALGEDKTVLVAAHGNSLRALRMYLDKLSGDEVVALEIPTGKPFVYEFDDDFNIVKSYYL